LGKTIVKLQTIKLGLGYTTQTAEIDKDYIGVKYECNKLLVDFRFHQRSAHVRVIFAKLNH